MEQNKSVKLHSQLSAIGPFSLVHNCTRHARELSISASGSETMEISVSETETVADIALWVGVKTCSQCSKPSGSFPPIGRPNAFINRIVKMRRAGHLSGTGELQPQQLQLCQDCFQLVDDWIKSEREEEVFRRTGYCWACKKIARNVSRHGNNCIIYRQAERAARMKERTRQRRERGPFSSEVTSMFLKKKSS